MIKVEQFGLNKGIFKLLAFVFVFQSSKSLVIYLMLHISWNYAYKAWIRTGVSQKYGSTVKNAVSEKFQINLNIYVLDIL